MKDIRTIAVAVARAILAIIGAYGLVVANVHVFWAWTYEESSLRCAEWAGSSGYARCMENQDISWFFWAGVLVVADSIAITWLLTLAWAHVVRPALKRAWRQIKAWAFRAHVRLQLRRAQHTNDRT